MPLLHENNRRLISSLVMSLIHRQWESNAGICYAVDAAGISCSPRVFLPSCHQDYVLVWCLLKWPSSPQGRTSHCFSSFRQTRLRFVVELEVLMSVVHLPNYLVVYIYFYFIFFVPSIASNSFVELGQTRLRFVVELEVLVC